MRVRYVQSIARLNRLRIAAHSECRTKDKIRDLSAYHEIRPIKIYRSGCILVETIAKHSAI